MKRRKLGGFPNLPWCPKLPWLTVLVGGHLRWRGYLERLIDLVLLIYIFYPRKQAKKVSLCKKLFTRMTRKNGYFWILLNSSSCPHVSQFLQAAFEAQRLLRISDLRLERLKARANLIWPVKNRVAYEKSWGWNRITKPVQLRDFSIRIKKY